MADAVQTKLVFDIAELKQQVAALQAQVKALVAKGQADGIPAVPKRRLFDLSGGRRKSKA